MSMSQITMKFCDVRNPKGSADRASNKTSFLNSIRFLLTLGFWVMDTHIDKDEKERNTFY